MPYALALDYVCYSWWPAGAGHDLTSRAAESKRSGCVELLAPCFGTALKLSGSEPIVLLSASCQWLS